MVLCPQKYLGYVASFLKIQLGKVSLNEDCIYTRTLDKKVFVGTVNIINSLLIESNSNLAGINPSEKAEIYQWTEYAIVYGIHVDKQNNTNNILNELNGIIATKTYLVSDRLTIADVLWYYILFDTMALLSSSEKEKYINVSRWFDNLQQNSTLRQSNQLIDFRTNYFINVAPLRR